MNRQKTILALFCALLVLSTSLGAVLYQHFCGASLKEVALSKKESHCMKHQSEGLCHHKSEKEGCCKTEVKDLNTSEKKPAAHEDYGIAKRSSQFVTVFYVLVQYLFTNPFENKGDVVADVSPDPPPIQADSLIISYQSFLI